MRLPNIPPLKFHNAVVASALALVLGCVTAEAQLALSANDGKQPLLGTIPRSHTPDNVVVLDLTTLPLKVIGTVEVPTSMIGPPDAVAIAHNGTFALVSNAQKFDPSDPTKFVLDNTVSVIDLKDPRHPTVIQTVQAGAGATGISLNRSDTLALVAATSGTISVFSVAGKKLTLVSTVQLDPNARPVDVAISPDGNIALVAQRSAPVLVRLAINGVNVAKTGIEIPTGYQTYGVVFSLDGKFAYNTNLGGRLAPNGQPGPAPALEHAPKIGTVTVVDLRSNRVVNTVDVGQTPEHLVLSHDGKYLALTVGNGSSAHPGTPNYHPYGLLKLYSVDGPSLTEVAETKTGGWDQGAVWNRDHSLILVQTAMDKKIVVYRFDGSSLTPQPVALTFDARPGSISTALSR